jgi:hypothetical protein
MKLTRIKVASLALALGALGSGCGEMGDGTAEVGDEQVGEVQSALTATGCAAIKVSSEHHVGTFFEALNPDEIYVKTLSWRIYNPSTTSCASVELALKFTNDLTGAVIYQTTLATSLSAGKYRLISWPVEWDSRTYRPKTDSNEDSWLYANGRLLKATYLPQYFLSTGQY